MASRHCSLSDTPAKAEGGHQDSVGHFDDQEGGERLPGELRDWSDGADEGVLVPGKVGSFLEAESSAISQYGLVQDLSIPVSSGFSSYMGPIHTRSRPRSRSSR